jgi:branched-chain amino acid aminotransferase
VLAYLNGQYIPADRPALPINDRSFLYGDGLFETIRITNGQPFLWREHVERLQRGADFLKIPIPLAPDALEQAARHLLAQNDTPEGFVRIHLSRGSSERGYAIPATPNPIVVITTHRSLHTQKSGLKLITSSIRILSNDPLAQHKTANRLPNILARQQAEGTGAEEALIINNLDQIAGASAANIFIVRGRNLITPPLNSGALAGTTRAFVLQIALQHNLTPVEKPLVFEDLLSADATFLTSANLLVAPAISLDNAPLPQNATAAIQTLRTACRLASGENIDKANLVS